MCLSPLVILCQTLCSGTSFYCSQQLCVYVEKRLKEVSGSLQPVNGRETFKNKPDYQAVVLSSGPSHPLVRFVKLCTIRSISHHSCSFQTIISALSTCVLRENLHWFPEKTQMRQTSLTLLTTSLRSGGTFLSLHFPQRTISPSSIYPWSIIIQPFCSSSPF